MFKGIDLYSDTATRPTPEMRKTMLEAEVGDEQKGEDPTTCKLEEKVADVLGFSSALFLPSATMANEIAIRLHCEPGEKLFAAGNSHVMLYEGGGPAVHAQVLMHPIFTPTGIFDGKMLEENFRPPLSPHFPIPKLVSIENPTNSGGGIPWPLDTLDSVLEMSKKLNLKIHLDGARLFNAVVKLGVKPTRLTRGFDSVTLCLSKGLGCPVGALLALPLELRPKALRLKHLFGGAMRQSGILSAAGLYALEHHVDHLKEDHENASRLAGLLKDQFKWIQLENSEPATNMVYFRWTHPHVTPSQFLEKCLSSGLRFSTEGSNRFRAVTHLDIERKDIDTAISILGRICEEMG